MASSIVSDKHEVGVFVIRAIDCPTALACKFSARTRTVEIITRSGCMATVGLDELTRLADGWATLGMEVRDDPA